MMVSSCVNQDKCKAVFIIHVLWSFLIIVLNTYLQKGKKQRLSTGRLLSTLNKKFQMSIISKKDLDRKYCIALLKTQSFQGCQSSIRIMCIHSLTVFCTFNAPAGLLCCS